MTDIKNIRKAITANRGGLKNATDEQLWIIWQTLDDETRTKYLNSLKGDMDDTNSSG